MPKPIHSHRLEVEGPVGTSTEGTPVVAAVRARARLLVLPRPQHWLLLGVLLVAAVIALGLTVRMVPGLSSGELVIDQDLSEHHSGLFTAVAMTLNLLFGPVGGVLVVAVVALFLSLVRRAPVNAVAFGFAAVSGWVACEFFKILVARHRPDQSLLVDPLATESGSDSFPSGHVTFAVTLAFAVYFLARGTRWSKAAAVAGVLVTVVVAWSRLYIGVHYPSDVLGSLLAGTAAIILFAVIWNLLAPRVGRRMQASAAYRRFMP